MTGLYDTPGFFVSPFQPDAMVRRQLEAEVLQQWFESDSAEMPPEIPDFDPTDQKAGFVWSPASAAQKMALECMADIILYGGSAGSLKSETLLVNFAAEIGNGNYNAIIFRQSFPELRDLVKKSIRLYTPLGGKFTKGSPLVWNFPSGAQIWLGYLGHDDDVYAHQGQEYSAIGFDEAGHQTEVRIRYMLTRLRTTDKTLRTRMFLTANPGGPGHSMLMHVFLRGICPHCEPKRCVEPGKLYYDATWKSDGQPLSVTLPSGKRVMKSVAFIPGKITDHNLLGDDYIGNLMNTAAATAKMLLDGCWKAWEGQFFDCFMETRGCDEEGRRLKDGPDRRMVAPRCDFDVKHWYSHVIGGDYGFSISAAAAHLGVRLPPDEHYKNGRLLILDEYMKPGVTAKDYANELLQRWFLEEDTREPGRWFVPEKARAIHLWAVSPDAWRKDGVVNDMDVAESRIEQMNKVMGEWGFAWAMANNDRPGGWMKMYQMLRDGELVIARECKNTIEMFQTRLKDKKKFDDIEKVSGDPLDDVADSLRYLVMTYSLNAVKPREEVLQEAIKGLDPTNTMLTVRKFEAEERRYEEPISYSPKRKRGW